MSIDALPPLGVQVRQPLEPILGRFTQSPWPSGEENIRRVCEQQKGESVNNKKGSPL